MRATFLFVLVLLGGTTFAQESVFPPPPLNGFIAGQEAAARTREEALANIGRQIGLNDALRQRAAVAVPALPAGVVPGYPAQPVIGWPGPVGAGFPYGYSPWIYGPWDSYRLEIPPWAQVRQPIGQFEQQTAPNRWESRPIYAPDSVPAPGLVPAHVAPPQLAAPQTVPAIVTPSTPVSPSLGGTREF